MIGVALTRFGRQDAPIEFRSAIYNELRANPLVNRFISAFAGAT